MLVIQGGWFDVYKFPSHSLKPNPQPLKNWHSKRASPSRLTLINFGNPTKSLITRIKFYFDFNIKLHNWKLPILNRYYIRLYFRAYYAISTCILYYAANKHSVMLSLCREAVCCRCCRGSGPARRRPHGGGYYWNGGFHCVRRECASGFRP